MAASLQDIREWFNRAEAQKATHMIVMCDTYDYSDYPVFCFSEREARERAGNPGDMQSVMEVYKISIGWESQGRPGTRVRNF